MTLSPADDRLDPALDLQRVKGLGHVIVRPVIQAQDLVHVISARREHDDRHFREFADLLQDLEAGQLREHDIEQDDIKLLLADLGHRLLAVIGAVDFISLLHEAESEPLDDHSLIIHDQYLCRHTKLSCLLTVCFPYLFYLDV